MVKSLLTNKWCRLSSCTAWYCLIHYYRCVFWDEGTRQCTMPLSKHFVILYSYCRSMEAPEKCDTSFLWERTNNRACCVISLIHPELAAIKLEKNLSSHISGTTYLKCAAKWSALSVVLPFPTPPTAANQAAHMASLESNWTCYNAGVARVEWQFLCDCSAQHWASGNKQPVMREIMAITEYVCIQGLLCITQAILILFFAHSWVLDFANFEFL